MNYLQLTKDCLKVGEINDMVANESCGAISLFVGTTRDNFESKKVLCLEYEAYDHMALKKMQEICAELREKWSDIKNIAIYHRVGLVPVKEASVVIAVSSAHRVASLEAVAYAIDELKRRVPIWKKEKYDDNESAWKENKESSASSKGIKRFKRPPLNFDQCQVDSSQDGSKVTQNLIQIAAEEKEIHRRIKCFVQKKREEIDLHNILDFTSLPPEHLSEEISTCARTDSVIVKQEQSKCHLRVRRVENQIGPQTRPDYLHTLDKLWSKSKTHNSDMKIKQEHLNANETPAQNLSNLPALEERFQNIEQHLNMSKVINPQHIHQRLKAIENRILHLESISPEYKHFVENEDNITAKTKENARNITTNRQRKRKIYTVDELDAIIGQIQIQFPTTDWDEDYFEATNVKTEVVSS